MYLDLNYLKVGFGFRNTSLLAQTHGIENERNPTVTDFIENNESSFTNVHGGISSSL